MNAPEIDIAHLRTWVGRTRVEHDVAAVRHANLMAVTLGASGSPLQAGERLPPLWHWLYFLEGQPPAELGRDGHPARGGFLPPVPLSNRMWAGGRVTFAAPIALGGPIEKQSRVLGVERKRGRSGELVFVTVQHEVFSDGQCCVREEHDIVYKEASTPVVAGGDQPRTTATHGRQIVPDSTMLFRYSALTFNGHRIHYDQDYCRRVEGYPDLVIHGPLVATLLAGFAEEIAGRPLAHFSYRGLRPAFLGEMLMLAADRTGDALSLSCSLRDGSVSMRAQALVQGYG